MSATPAAAIEGAAAQSLPDVPGAESDTAAAADDAAAAERRELVLIDTSVSDYQQLVDALAGSAGEGRELEVHLIDAQPDGIEQITALLAGSRELDAVHLISHGSDGRLRIGSDWLDSNSLNADAEQIRSWSASLNPGADLLIYGCDLASTNDGRSLVESLSQLCGCDVTASDDGTGHVTLGGDWELEFATGVIETAAPLSESLQQDWTGLLAVSAVIR